MSFDKKSLIRLMLLSSILGLSSFCDTSAIEKTDVDVKVALLGNGNKGSTNTGYTISQNEQDEDCPICLEGSTDAKTKCGHQYHAKCLESWLKQHDHCPVCRRILIEGRDKNNNPVAIKKLNPEEQKLIDKVKAYANNLPKDKQEIFCKEVDRFNTSGFQLKQIAQIKDRTRNGKKVTWDMFREILTAEEIKKNKIDAHAYEMTTDPKNKFSDNDISKLKSADKDVVSQMQSLHEYYLKKAWDETDPDKQNYWIDLAGCCEGVHGSLKPSQPEQKPESETTKPTPTKFDDSVTKEELEQCEKIAAQATYDEVIKYGRAVTNINKDLHQIQKNLY